MEESFILCSVSIYGTLLWKKKFFYDKKTFLSKPTSLYEGRTSIEAKMLEYVVNNKNILL